MQGWRVGVVVLAVLLAMSTFMVHRIAFTVFDGHDTGYLNGRFARAQQVARAAGPVLAAWAVTMVSYSAVLAVLGVAFGGLAISPLLRTTSRRAAGGLLAPLEVHTPKTTE